MTPMNRRPT